jgi:hypothetical protein
MGLVPILEGQLIRMGLGTLVQNAHGARLRGQASSSLNSDHLRVFADH